MPCSHAEQPTPRLLPVAASPNEVWILHRVELVDRSNGLLGPVRVALIADGFTQHVIAAGVQSCGYVCWPRVLLHRTIGQHGTPTHLFTTAFRIDVPAGCVSVRHLSPRLAPAFLSEIDASLRCLWQPFEPLGPWDGAVLRFRARLAQWVADGLRQDQGPVLSNTAPSPDGGPPTPADWPAVRFDARSPSTQDFALDASLKKWRIPARNGS